MGMALLLSAPTCETVRPSLFALASSRNLMRSVAILPGKIMLQVIPSWATSRASVLDQPTRDKRSALEIAKFGMGVTTPDDVLVMIRPHFLIRMPGNTRSVMASTDKTMV